MIFDLDRKACAALALGHEHVKRDDGIREMLELSLTTAPIRLSRERGSPRSSRVAADDCARHKSDALTLCEPTLCSSSDSDSWPNVRC